MKRLLNPNSICLLFPEKVTCLSPEIRDWSQAVKVICNSAHCDQSGFMHADCFDKFQGQVLLFLSKQGRGRTWNDKQVGSFKTQTIIYDEI